MAALLVVATVLGVVFWSSSGVGETGETGEADVDVAGEPSVPGALDPDLVADAFDAAGLDSQNPTSSWSAASLEEGASDLLEAYSQQEGCALAQSGYLDMKGQVWGCVVVGQGWADVCMVKQASSSGEEDTASAQVYCWRIDQASLAATLGE